MDFRPSGFNYADCSALFNDPDRCFDSAITRQYRNTSQDGLGASFFSKVTSFDIDDDWASLDLSCLLSCSSGSINLRLKREITIIDRVRSGFPTVPRISSAYLDVTIESECLAKDGRSCQQPASTMRHFATPQEFSVSVASTSFGDYTTFESNLSGSAVPWWVYGIESKLLALNTSATFKITSTESCNPLP